MFKYLIGARRVNFPLAMHFSLRPSSRASLPQAQPKPNDDEFAPTDAPPAYTPSSSDPTPSSRLAHPAYVPPPNRSAPPQWEASVGDAHVAQLYPYGIYHDAGHDNFERGVRFCEMHPNTDFAQYITSQQHDMIFTQGIGAWTLTPPSQFKGKVSRNRDGTTEVKTNFSPTIDKTLVSSLPLVWGRYDPPEHSKGVYYEVEINKLGKDAVVAIGFGCLPYPTDFRLPGWHRQSAAVHSDDGFKYFENPNGGVPFMNSFGVNGSNLSTVAYF